MNRSRRRTCRAYGAGLLVLAGLVIGAGARGQNADEGPVSGDPSPFVFAVASQVAGSGTGVDDRIAASALQSIGASPARFVVQFDLSDGSAASCDAGALQRRGALLAASVKPAVPVIAGSAWADCGRLSSDPLDRLERVGDALFGSDESFGQVPMPWLRQSTMPRFRRYRENLRWQSGRVLFATLNLPDNNNDFRRGAGRNGEFDDRVVANRAWLERTFRYATERKVAGIVLFFDAAPNFDTPLRPPDPRSAERDGYYEFKVALRDHAAVFTGRVLIVQAHRSKAGPRSALPNPSNPSPATRLDQPLHDVAGRPLGNVQRITVADENGSSGWMRIDVDPATAPVFRVKDERLFDDPSGELYGASRPR